MKTKLTKRGQTVVPAEIRKRFKLDTSSSLVWMIEGDIITVLPIPDNPVKMLKGNMKGQMSFKKFLEDRKSDRELEKKGDLG